jgi:hypothetical protein
MGVDYRSNIEMDETPRPADWLGCMAGTGTITGDIVAPSTEPNEWNVLAD